MADRLRGRVWTGAWRPARPVAARLGAALLVALLALAGVLLACPRVARADEAGALENATALYEAGKYAEAHQLLSRLVDGQPPPCDGQTVVNCSLFTAELVERAQALDAASLLGLKRIPEADAVIETILLNDPNYVPSTTMFPQDVFDRFFLVRGKIAPKLAKVIQQQQAAAQAKRLALQKAREDQERWIEELRTLAKRERVAQTNSRFIALIPFGMGQFQNGDTGLGIFFATTEIATAAASIVPFVLSYNLAAMQPGEGQIPPANDRFKTFRIANNISFGLWGALVLTGVIHAQVTFVPERVTFRDRQIPDRPKQLGLKLVPIAAPIPHGAIVGLGGTF
jgi:hypothetical protein